VVVGDETAKGRGFCSNKRNNISHETQLWEGSVYKKKSQETLSRDIQSSIITRNGISVPFLLLAMDGEYTIWVVW
jgi:hypothetical protein